VGLRHAAAICGVSLAALAASAAPARADTVLELYGTFQSMGVIVTLTTGEDADGDATAAVSYRVAGSGSYRQGLPLVRVAPTRFVGSLFWLTHGTSYDVRVTFADPDGAPLDGLTVSRTEATRLELISRSATAFYHVAPTGTGTTCSFSVPCALGTALGLVQAGQEVILHGGVYGVGELTVPRSGSAGSPIVIRGQIGESAVLDGGDPATFSWSAQGGGVYRATVNVGDPHLVLANGKRLYPYQSLADLQALTWGIPGFFASGTAVYVRLASDADPAGASMVVSRFNNAFLVQQSYVYFINLTFRHYGRGTYAKALYFDDASDNLVDSCTFTSNDLGIGLKRASHRNVIQNSTFSDTDFDWPWDAVKADSELETGGVRMYDPMTGRGTVIRRNTFHDYFDGFGVCPASAAGLTNETDVHDNLVYNAGDDGMETDGQCSNVRIWRNTMHDVLMGISLAPVVTGPVYAVRNVVYRTGVGNNVYTGSTFKFNSSDGASGAIFLFHNTGDAALPGNSGLDVRSPGSWTGLYARNNVWAGTDYAVSNANPDQPIDLDYDDLWTTQTGELAWWSSLADRHLNTLAELQAATGLESHGLNAAPGFVDSTTGDYRPGAASPLVDKGLLIPGVNDDYAGIKPDIGAFEYSGAPVFADDPLSVRSTPVKRVHVTELRQAVASLRTRYGLPPASWSDDPLEARSTVVRAVHVLELRAALGEVYSAASRQPPAYSRATLTATSTSVAAVDIAELRAAVTAIW
jgi:parallel beta-helix repeat protein